MIKSYHRYLILLIVMVSALFVLPVVAQDDNVSDDEVNEVARDIYCPVCENTPLDVCQTKACADWRELIRTKLAGGETKDDIFSYFARQYGDGVLANPPSRGLSLVILWVLPVVLILLGLLFFMRYLQGIRRTEPQPAPAGPELNLNTSSEKSEPAPNDYLARVEEELDYHDE